jgi:hypothetical protein
MTDRTDSQIIDDIGGTGYIAKKLGVKDNTISTWRSRGIPWYGKIIFAYKFKGKVPADWKYPQL